MLSLVDKKTCTHRSISMKINEFNVTTRKKILISHIFKTHVPWLSQKFYIHRFRYKRSGIVNRWM